jgi:hypothetical protein
VYLKNSMRMYQEVCVLSSRGLSEYHDCRVDEAMDFLGAGEYQASNTLYIDQVGGY